MPEQDPAEQTDEELVAAIPPKDGSANDPVAKAEEHLDNVDLASDREALKQIQKDIPSGG